MAYVFQHLDSIKRLLKQPPFGLITDVDGTLSPIAPTPQEAEVTPLCHRYLTRLCHHLALVAAVSGRPAAEVRRMVGIDGMVYIGNHGLERWLDGITELAEPARVYPALIAATIKDLSRRLKIDGLLIEDKGSTAAIHYRLSPEPELAEKAIREALESIPEVMGLRVLHGKKVFEILPALEINKGTATADLIQRYNLRSALYLGDDRTDIDAFRVIHTFAGSQGCQGYAIAIVNREMPQNLAAEADFILNGVDDVGRFLKWLSQTAAVPD